MKTVILILIFPVAAGANAPADVVKWLVTPPAHRDGPTWHGGKKVTHLTPYHSMKLRVYRDQEYAEELVAAFEYASILFDVPRNLLMAMAYRETVFRPHLVGPAGERGILQTGKQAMRSCSEWCGGVETPGGGALCGACWLKKAKNWCGSYKGAIFAYVSGKCSHNKINVRRAVENRLLLWEILDDMTEINAN